MICNRLGDRRFLRNAQHLHCCGALVWPSSLPASGGEEAALEKVQGDARESALDAGKTRAELSSAAWLTTKVGRQLMRSFCFRTHYADFAAPNTQRTRFSHYQSRTSLSIQYRMLVPRASLDLALPLVKNLPECADFSKTVQPYLPQLYDLPYKILESINDRQALQSIYVSTNPLMSGLAFALVMTVIVLVVSEINRNYSQVDRLWSLLPVIYNVHYDVWAHMNGLPTAKLDHIMALSVIWGARLTFNYWRKGGYQVGSEDYRWNTVKDYVGPVPMFIFNILFISLAQNVSITIVRAFQTYSFFRFYFGS